MKTYNEGLGQYSLAAEVQKAGLNAHMLILGTTVVFCFVGFCMWIIVSATEGGLL